MTDLKKAAAEKAVELIQDGTKVLGLGAGSTIAHVVDFLLIRFSQGHEIIILTSSAATSRLLLEKGITPKEIADFSEIDLYLDGCDQVDRNLNALKSGGGIHTLEKLMASMAQEFVIVADESKFVGSLDKRFPIVVELIPQALHYVRASIEKYFPRTRTSIRMSPGNSQFLLTANGNLLLDCWFDKFPELSTINPMMKNITGVLETSLFYGLANRAVVAGSGGVKVIERTNYELLETK